MLTYKYHELKVTMKYNQIAVSLSNKELELIEQYAVTRGIKKATAVKELAIRGLELTVKPNNELKDKITRLLSNLDINRSLYTITHLIDKQHYTEALTVLNHIKDHTNIDDNNKMTAVYLAIHEVSKYI